MRVGAVSHRLFDRLHSVLPDCHPSASRRHSMCSPLRPVCPSWCPVLLSHLPDRRFEPDMCRVPKHRPAPSPAPPGACWRTAHPQSTFSPKNGDAADYASLVAPTLTDPGAAKYVRGIGLQYAGIGMINSIKQANPALKTWETVLLTWA